MKGGPSPSLNPNFFCMRRPWNIIDTAVYSLATTSSGHVNMNICTYVTAVSRKPKQYVVAIDYDSLTFKNLDNNSACVLQILSSTQLTLIRKLGKTSGNRFNKMSWLEAKGELTTWNGNTVLKHASAYLQLKKLYQWNTGSDHEIFCFEVEKLKTNQEGNVLMFQDLIASRVIL